MWARFVAFVKKLLGIVDKQVDFGAPDRPSLANTASPAARPDVAKVAIDYSHYAALTPYEISTRVFPNGLPVEWNWEAWALAAGRPNPQTYDNRNQPIEPMSPFENPASLTDHGEMDLRQGEMREVTLTRPGSLSWAAHRPQYRGPCVLHIGFQIVEGAYMNVELQPGTHRIIYVTGPAQGLRVALRARKS